MAVLTERTLGGGPAARSAAETHHAQALFASALQASESPSAEQVRRAVAATLQRLGTVGCAGQLAGEFGDHPELAVARMSWALATIRSQHGPLDVVPTPVPRALALAG